MREILDIRADEDWMQREFGDSLGKPMSLVRPTGDETVDAELRRLAPATTRRIIIDTRDTSWNILKERFLAAQRRSGFAPYSSISVTRKYTRKELSQGELFQLILTKMFEPCGVDKGTVYDDSHTCPKCGFGRVQRSPLRLNLNRVPKRVDLAFTIARNEWIVSQRLADLMLRQRLADQDRLTGFRLEQVEHRGRRSAEQPWYQLVVTASAGHTVSPTRFAIDEIRDDPQGRFVCPAHALSGLNLVSEVYVRRSDVGPEDVLRTENRWGIFSGVLMPVPVLLISPRMFRMLKDSGIKGYKIEVAHLVD